ncbi:MAG: hypothetical protein GX224_06330 [Thermoplasmatales archaeon]|nr:hypothetical protein [Thermoplasmatales archaeon]
MEGVITYEEFTRAIVNSPRHVGEMQGDEAAQVARNVLNFFGYYDRIIDNVLDPETRNMFYMLEDASLLTTEREETTLYDGREWRVHYWLFRRDRIAALAEAPAEPLRKVEEEESVYEMDDSIWERSAPGGEGE